MARSIEARRQAQKEYYWRNIEAIRAKRPGIIATFEKRHPLHFLVQKLKHTAKARGLEFAITVADVVWPTHCPILGVELCYERDKKKKQLNRCNYPTFDRWDNRKGYVPGNVFIISWLANQTKSRLSVESMEALLQYMKEKPSLVAVPVVDVKAISQPMEPRPRKITKAMEAKIAYWTRPYPYGS